MHPQRSEHSPDYRTVAVYWTIADAEVARSLLHADGIPAAFLETGDAPLLPGLGSGPVRLLVPADDLERARGMLTASTAESESAAREPQPAGQASPWSTWVAVTVAALAGLGALWALAL